MVKEIISLEGEKVFSEFYRRNFSLPHDVAKTPAKEIVNDLFKSLILDELDKLEPEVTNEVNDLNEQQKRAAVQYYINTIRFFIGRGNCFLNKR